MRGLTLVETVIATSLLAALVLACVPVLSGARRDLTLADPEGLRHRHDAFAAAVDHLLDTRPGLAAELLHAEETTLRWEHAGLPVVARVSRIALEIPEEGERRSPHLWVSFASHDLEIARWVRVPRILLEPVP